MRVYCTFVYDIVVIYVPLLKLHLVMCPLIVLFLLVVLSYWVSLILRCVHSCTVCLALACCQNVLFIKVSAVLDVLDGTYQFKLYGMYVG
jgi:hypothetical protein